jgi:exonuclease VII small subunit
MSSVAPTEEVLRTLDGGFEWHALTGMWGSYDEFSSMAKERLGRAGFPPSFSRFFANTHPMPYAATEVHRGAPCVGILFRVPESIAGLDAGYSVSTMTNRVVVLARLVSGPGSTVLTYHKKPLVATLKMQAQIEHSNTTARAFLPALIKRLLAEYHPALNHLQDVLEEWESDRADFVTAVERLSKVQKQAGVLKRCLKSLSESFDAMDVVVGLEESIQAYQEGAKVQANVADELETNATSNVSLMIALDGFKGGQNVQIFTYLNFVCQPISAVTGWYGMGWINIPETQDPHGYWIFIGFAIFSTVTIITFLITRP